MENSNVKRLFLSLAIATATCALGFLAAAVGLLARVARTGATPALAFLFVGLSILFTLLTAGCGAAMWYRLRR